MDDGVLDISDEVRYIDLSRFDHIPLGEEQRHLEEMNPGSAREGDFGTEVDVKKPSSPLTAPTIYPLPLPLDHSLDLLHSEQNPSDAPSPLGRLFEYTELIPLVLKWFERPSQLASLARVNRTFYEITQKKLYRHIWIRPWESHCDEKLVLLFRILRDRPDLCSLIRHLEVRFFPLAMKDAERYELDDSVMDSIRGMKNLEQLVWTRDKSLNPVLVDTFTRLPKLSHLEISGHSSGYYDPMSFCRMDSLEDLRIMMPDSLVRDSFRLISKRLSERPGGGLRGLAFVAGSSPLIDDSLLRDVAEQSENLTRFTLWGCTRVTRDGVYEIINHAKQLKELSIDASQNSNLCDLSHSPDLSHLSTLSISFTPSNKSSLRRQFDSSDLPRLPPLPNLSSLFLTLSLQKVPFPSDGIEVLSRQINFDRLKKLSILNMFMDSHQLSTILLLCPIIEELYLSIQGSFVIPESHLIVPNPIPTRLRILHLNAPERSVPTLDDLKAIAQCHDSLQQIGTGNRVYEVHRRWKNDRRIIELCRWSRTFAPGYFQNWRG